MIREVAFSHFFGATPLFSSFRFAFQLPNLTRKLFGEGALTSSFVPVFAKTRELDGDDEAQKLAGGVFAMLAICLTGLLILAEAGLILGGVMSNWKPVWKLAGIMMPYMVLICGTAFLGSTLNVLGYFAIPAIAPMILNVIMIAATWFGGSRMGLAPEDHLVVVALSVLVSGVCQMGLQWWWLARRGMRPQLNLDWSSPRTKRVIHLMLPLMVGVSAVQFNTFADSLIAYFMVKDGRGVAILSYAQYMNNLPLGIFATAIATAIFPMLARHVANRNDKDFMAAVSTGLRTSLFVAIPAGIGLMLVAVPMVRVLFEHGEFSPSDTPRVARAISCYALGMWAYSIQQILVRAFYSLEDNRTPVRISITMLCLNFVLNIILVMTPLREGGVALATATTGTLQGILLAVTLRKRLPAMQWAPLVSMALRCVAASAVMAAVVATLRGWSPLGPILPEHVFFELVACVVGGAAAYLVAARVLKVSELSLILHRRR